MNPEQVKAYNDGWKCRAMGIGMAGCAYNGELQKAWRKGWQDADSDSLVQHEDIERQAQ